MKTDNSDSVSGNMPDEYDRVLSKTMEAQAVQSTRPAMIRAVPLFGIGGTATYSLTTFRQAGDILEENVETGAVKRGPATFMAFLEVAKGERLQRIILPDEVLALVQRQRDALVSLAQKRAAKAAAATRKARGHVPTFGGRRGGGRRKKKG